MKQLSDILVELQALGTVAEDQFEASLATVVADLQAVVSGQTTVTPVTVTSVVVNFSDSTSKEFDPKA